MENEEHVNDGNVDKPHASVVMTEEVPLQQNTLVKADEAPDFDSYTTSKSFAQNNLNLAAIGVQISLLLEVLNNETLTGYQIGLIILVSSSLAFQLIIFAFVTILAAAKGNSIEKFKVKCSIVAFNATITFLTGCVLVLALAISGITTYARIAGSGGGEATVNTTTAPA